MRIWETILQARQELACSKATTALTIGNFDGVHRGHRQIMRRTVELAGQTNSLAVVVTFKEHSDGLLGEQPLRLNTPAIRQRLIAAQKIDRMLEVEFDPQFAALEAEAFFQKWMLEGLHARAIIVGYDFRFGAARRGDYKMLQSLGQERQVLIEQEPPLREAGEIISSSKIRQLLAEGRIDQANQMLGYEFVIEGEVVKGEQRGRKLGFPTANLHLDNGYLLPCYGVYLVRLTEERSYFGIANVGIKPTFGQYFPRVEVYLFDVEVNLYTKLVRVEFLKFIRPENRFSGPEALKAQIMRDIAVAYQYLNVISAQG